MDIKYGRKRSGIKKELTEKINSWLKTITDEQLVKDIEADVIITGGSIASMLLGEPVNDFDLYFRNTQTAYKVASYYAAQQKSLLAVTKLDDRVTIDVMGNGVVVTEKKETESEAKKKYRPVFFSPNAITLTDKIQIITRFCGEPSEIHNNYDFVHATCYWDHAKKHLELPAEAMECLLSRTLIYQGSLYPIASIFRAKKFLQRGWRISAGQQLKIMWQINELDLTNMNVVKEQLTGVDMLYLFELFAAIKDEENELVDSTYIARLIDEIFDEGFT